MLEHCHLFIKLVFSFQEKKFIPKKKKKSCNTTCVLQRFLFFEKQAVPYKVECVQMDMGLTILNS